MKQWLGVTFGLISCATFGATPVDGWYLQGYGGFTYLPSNINTTRDALFFSNGKYDSGYHFGGKLGYKMTPFRFDADVSYLTTKSKQFDVDAVPQTDISGNGSATIGFINMYYDFSDLSDVIEPYVGLGLGGAWLDSRFYSTGPTTSNRFKATNTVLAYNATLGMTYNFSENYALDVGYRYIRTANADEFGKSFSAHQLSLGAIYRFDEANYK